MAEGTLTSEIVARVRRRVNDERSRRWRTDEPILEKMSHARRHVSHVFGRIAESGYYEKDTDETLLAANATSFVLPADFVGVKVLEWVRNPVALGGTGLDRVECGKVKRNNLNAYRTTSPVDAPGDRPGYQIVRGPGANGKLVKIIRPSAQARYFTVKYHHQFVDFTYPIPALDKVDIPTEHDELLELYAAILLAENDKKLVAELKGEYQRIETELLSVFQGAEDEVGVETVDADWHNEFNAGVL